MLRLEELQPLKTLNMSAAISLEDNGAVDATVAAEDGRPSLEKKEKELVAIRVETGANKGSKVLTRGGVRRFTTMAYGERCHVRADEFIKLYKDWDIKLYSFSDKKELMGWMN